MLVLGLPRPEEPPEAVRAWLREGRRRKGSHVSAWVWQGGRQAGRHTHMQSTAATPLCDYVRRASTARSAGTSTRATGAGF